VLCPCGNGTNAGHLLMLFLNIQQKSEVVQFSILVE
jgi:hypothetical protein